MGCGARAGSAVKLPGDDEAEAAGEDERALGLARHDGRVRRLGLVFLRTLWAIGLVVAKRSNTRLATGWVGVGR